MSTLRERIVKSWDTADDFTGYVRYGYLLKKNRQLTHAGRTTMRMVVKDGNGNEVAFPLSLTLEVTFHDA